MGAGARHPSSISLARTGRLLGVDHELTWIRTAASIERLLAAWWRLPHTLVYDDFHVSNVAVRRMIGGEVAPVPRRP